MRERVLITRPDLDSQEIATLIRQKGYEVECEAFLKVVLYQQNVENLNEYTGLVFTSRNGVRAFCQNEQSRDLPVWTVGGATKELAQEYGFKDVHSAEGDVQSLARITTKIGHNKILYVRGQHVSQDLDIPNVEEIILYHTEIIEEINSDVLSSIGKGVFSHVLFFSKRTVQSFVRTLKNAGDYGGLKATRCLCFGDSMVSLVSVLPWQSVEVAEQPNKEAMLKLLD